MGYGSIRSTLRVLTENEPNETRVWAREDWYADLPRNSPHPTNFWPEIAYRGSLPNPDSGPVSGQVVDLEHTP